MSTTLVVAAVCVQQLFLTNDSSQILAFVGNVGAGFFASAVQGWLAAGKNPSMDEIAEVLIQELKAVDQLEGLLVDFERQVGVLEMVLRAYRRGRRLEPSHACRARSAVSYLRDATVQITADRRISAVVCAS